MRTDLALNDSNREGVWAALVFATGDSLRIGPHSPCAGRLTVKKGN